MALGGPDWLTARRAGAWERFAASAVPTEAEEVWRYSGIDAFDLDAYAPAAVPVAPSGAALALARGLADSLGPRAGLVVTRNGHVEAVEMSPSVPSDAVSVTSARAGGPIVPEHLGELAPARDAFGELHDAFVADAVVVRVARKAVVGDPVVVVHLVDAAVDDLVDTAVDGDSGGRGVSVFPRVLVALGTSAEAGVIELTAPASMVDGRRPAGGEGDSDPRAALVVPVTELHVADDARLRYANLQVLARGTTCMAVQASRVGRDATLRSFTAGLGGRYSRVRTDSDLVGQAGRTALLAAYLGTGDQVHDFRTLQDHHAPRTESELLFKGAVADTARSVYSGLIRIRRGARGANAFQTNHNLVLSEGAHADSVPNLDIDENDVRCSHASTVGPIDEDQRYYLETRGIEPVVAERLVILGFFSDLAGRAPFPGVGRWVEDAVGARLTGRLPAERGAGEHGAAAGHGGSGATSGATSGPDGDDG
ncbi:MAG TPA: SufD family Fe-S cluster assembly protein [Acidimicrobiales bacterium]|nr:SufD family Fe-S cluster assembly protein [Acidimicrobiales bacterium]